MAIIEQQTNATLIAEAINYSSTELIFDQPEIYLLWIDEETKKRRRRLTQKGKERISSIWESLPNLLDPMSTINRVLEGVVKLDQKFIETKLRQGLISALIDVNNPNYDSDPNFIKANVTGYLESHKTELGQKRVQSLKRMAQRRLSTPILNQNLINKTASEAVAEHPISISDDNNLLLPQAQAEYNTYLAQNPEAALNSVPTPEHHAQERRGWRTMVTGAIGMLRQITASVQETIDYLPERKAQLFRALALIVPPSLAGTALAAIAATGTEYYRLLGKLPTEAIIKSQELINQLIAFFRVS